MSVRRLATTLAIALVLPLCAACRDARPAARRSPPLVVVGVDGLDRKPIRALWERGELPNLRRLADSGTYLPLRTAYAKSPVIWTTIATGVRPDEHGIEDFVVATPKGDVPVASTHRRRPALWNFLEKVGRRSAVLGWWATWPAESIADSVVLSDRAGLGLDHEISPPERADDLARWLAAAADSGLDFGGTGPTETRDRAVALAAEQLVREPFDLVLVYFRSVDVVSHWQWHTFQPEKFPDGPPRGVARVASAEPVLDVYRTVDAALGRIARAAPEGTSFLVVSDHGFQVERRHDVSIHLDLDRVLQALGLLQRTPDGAVDPARTRAFTHLSPPFRQAKLVRLAAGLTPDERSATLAELERGLARVRFPDGSPAFALGAPGATESERGADLVVRITASELWDRVELEGRPVAGAVLPVARLTGTHDRHTSGVLFASGPLFARQPKVDGVRIHDVAPTVLYALGLPVADDFAGQARTELFVPEFVTAHPLRRIASWGVREAGATVETEQDRELLEELAGLGYLN